METFALRPALSYGADALAALEELAGKRVLVVTDAFLAQSGLLDRVAVRLGGCTLRVFDGVTPDPSLQLVAQGVKICEAFQPDAVVAFGGGSPMDCAKGICWFVQPHPPLWCIPTTAGTGSEVTSFAVLTDKARDVKYPVVDQVLLPVRAILDPGFLDGVPPKVTADTGMDVLSHGIEAYAAQRASPFSDALAEKAVSLAYASLPSAFRGDKEAKAQMLYASCLAGMAFNAAGLGVCHAMAHSLGGRFHVPHGRLNAMLLPQVVAFNAADSATAEKYGRLARCCSLAGSPRALSAALVRLRGLLGMPSALAVPRADLEAVLPALAAAALADACLPGNPRAVTAQDLTGMMGALGK